VAAASSSSLIAGRLARRPAARHASAPTRISGCDCSAATSWPASLRVLLVRVAMTAAVTKEMLLGSGTRWKPAVSAAGMAVWADSRWLVCEVAIATKIANPSAPE
jgi:hypothetical protein